MKRIILKNHDYYGFAGVISQASGVLIIKEAAIRHKLFFVLLVPTSKQAQIGLCKDTHIKELTEKELSIWNLVPRDIKQHPVQKWQRTWQQQLSPLGLSTNYLGQLSEPNSSIMFCFVGSPFDHL